MIKSIEKKTTKNKQTKIKNKTKKKYTHTYTHTKKKTDSVHEMYKADENILCCILN